MAANILTVEQEARLREWYAQKLAVGTASKIAAELGVRKMFVYEWMYKQRLAQRAKKR